MDIDCEYSVIKYKHDFELDKAYTKVIATGNYHFAYGKCEEELEREIRTSRFHYGKVEVIASTTILGDDMYVVISKRAVTIFVVGLLRVDMTKIRRCIV